MIWGMPFQDHIDTIPARSEALDPFVFNPDPDVRRRVAKKLDPQSPLLAEMARDSDVSVRLTVLWKLPVDSPVLAEMARDKSEAVRLDASARISVFFRNEAV